MSWNIPIDLSGHFKPNHKTGMPPKKEKQPLRRTPLKKSGKPVKKVSEKRKERVANGDGEWPLFQAIWASRPHFCISCEKYLGEELKPIFCSHTIAKKKNESLRLYDRNIELECEECHDTWDNGTIEKKMALKSFEYKMERMKVLDPTVWELMMTKIEESKR